MIASCTRFVLSTALNHVLARNGLLYTLNLICASACKVNYSALRADIDKFNAEHKWLKRGVAIVGAKGNMGFMESDDINRGIAVVAVREDGL